MNPCQSTLVLFVIQPIAFSNSTLRTREGRRWRPAQCIVTKSKSGYIIVRPTWSVWGRSLKIYVGRRQVVRGHGGTNISQWLVIIDKRGIGNLLVYHSASHFQHMTCPFAVHDVQSYAQPQRWRFIPNWAVVCSRSQARSLKIRYVLNRCFGLDHPRIDLNTLRNIMGKKGSGFSFLKVSTSDKRLRKEDGEWNRKRMSEYLNKKRQIIYITYIRPF
jgi:hypothetical protein